MRQLIVLTLFLVFISQAQALPDGIDSRGDDGCLCHGGSDDTTNITIVGLPDVYNSSMEYNFTLTIESPVEENNPQGGFRILISHGEIIGDGWQLKDGGYTHSDEINHKRQWGAVWIAPVEDDRLGTFVIHGNAVDGDGSISGDEWNSITIAIPGQNYDGDVSNPELTGSLSATEIAIGTLAILVLSVLAIKSVRD